MGRSKKFDYQAVIESKLAEYPEGLTLDELLARSEFDVDRSTLFRHLSRLIQRGRIERSGNARASRYRLLVPAGSGGQAAADVPPATDAYTPRPAESDPPMASSSSATGHRPPAKPDPAPIEALEHGTIVKKAVRRIVSEWKRCNRTNLQIYLSLMVKPEQVDEFVKVVEHELIKLHPGNLPAFGLSPADFSGFVPPDRRAAPRN